MAATIPLKLSEMKRLAAFAKREGVRAEVEFNGVIFRVVPDHPLAKNDGSEETELDREFAEFAEFDRKHGYS